MPQAADIKDLQVAFATEGGPIIAVDEVSFTLQAGETLALLGESGCGKSLTATAMMRLLPLHAAYGQRSEINVQADDLLLLPEAIMRQLRGKKLAIIFQEPMTALNPVLTVAQQLAEALQKDEKIASKTLHQRMLGLLKEVEISEPQLRLQQYPHQLSGGQKQRVVIAMALANNPDILIADEPTTALDVTIQAQILNLLKKLQAQYQMSLLLITHDLAVVKAVADRVCVMYAGQVVEQADVAAFFAQVHHPYSQQLLASLPSFNKRGYRLQVIPGSVPAAGNPPAGCRFHPRCAHRFEPCDKQMPVLQTLAHDGEVRCHLYPQHDKPPSLNHRKEAWQTVDQEQAVILEAKDLQVYFTPGKTLFSKGHVIKAVDGLSLTLRRGKTLALVGESGCGKTTTSRALLRLQPISYGEIYFEGQDVTALTGSALRDYRKKIQIVFQDPFSSMNPRMTVGEIIAEGMMTQGMSLQTIERRSLQLLDQVNLSKDSLDRYPHQFSGGQRQRICIARALATEPEILICDEPTSALDVSVQAQILNLLKELQQQTNMAYLFITHNMAVVSYMADEVLVMRRGRVVEASSCEQILKHPQQDYTKRLLASVLQV